MDRICFYEREPDGFRPLVWLRPVWDLRAGGRTLLERNRALLGVDRSICHAGREGLDDLWRECTGEGLAGAVPLGGTLFLEAGVALDEAAAEQIRHAPAPFRLIIDGEMVGGMAGSPAEGSIAGGSALAAAIADAARTWPALELAVPLLRGGADLIRHLKRLITGDLSAYLAHAGPGVAPSEGVRVLGSGRYWIDPDAEIDPGTTLDCRGGDLVIEAGARLTGNVWLTAPAWVGRDTYLLGGAIGPLTAFGPGCRIRGEVAETIVQGHSNKAHDGFIGHSVLGEWVNLGAMTTCSDLKNNYSTIRLECAGETIETGVNKLGVFLGDHVKTAIGTLLTTGGMADVGANVFGHAGLGPRWTPGFAWGAGGMTPRATDLERFLATARVVLSRRGVAWTPAYEARLREVYEAC